MNYAKGIRVEGAKGTVYWDALKDDGVSFVVINGSKGEVDSDNVAHLIQEAYDNKMPAIIETIFDPEYYKFYGGVLEVDKNSDLHLRAALKGLESKTCYGYWIASYDPFDIPWNATALGQFVDRIRHELNNTPLNGPSFPMGIRLNQNWFNKSISNMENNMSWFYNKPDWLISAHWDVPIEEVMHPGTMNRETWNFMEYADGKYFYNGTVEQLYSEFGFEGEMEPPAPQEDPEPPPTELLPNLQLTEVYFMMKRLESALGSFLYAWEEFE